MEKLSEETCELMSELKDAVKGEGAICVISIGKGNYLSQAMHGTANDIVALLCCGVDQIAKKNRGVEYLHPYENIGRNARR